MVDLIVMIVLMLASAGLSIWMSYVKYKNPNSDILTLVVIFCWFLYLIITLNFISYIINIIFIQWLLKSILIFFF